MKNFWTKLGMGTGLIVALSTHAHAAVRYELTITNGSQMPISPGAAYVKSGGESAAPIGSTATSGFVQLCQTGNVANRIVELKANSNVSFVAQTSGPILPGESRSVEIEVGNPQRQSIHFEGMYGKSKDACGVGTLGSQSLTSLLQHFTSEVVEKDNAVSTGAFLEPSLPSGTTSLDAAVCASAANAVSCLRELASPSSGTGHLHFFTGYLPSVVTALEAKYGAADVQTLLFPTSGAIQLKLKLKH